MFANFNLDDFPFVNVKFAKSVKNEEDFDNFLKHWIILNAQNKPYSLIFDTTNIGFINPKYAFKMATFIKKLKNMEEKYLTQSIIIVNNSLIKNLLNVVMSIQKPVAKVYIVSDKENADRLYQNLRNNDNNINLENISVFNP